MDEDGRQTAPLAFQSGETSAAYVSALTVLQLGLDLLREPPRSDPANPEARALLALLDAAAARATDTGVALVEYRRFLAGRA
jgi:hypothetical protein